MADDPVASGSSASSEIINQAYDEELLKCMDVVERGDFYGVVGARGIRFFAEKLDLSPASHVLDLCSGIGGPARYLARTYGCRVTGIDLSQFNHRTGQQRTREAGLDHLVRFIHGNALEMPFSDESFTHVFGSEALCYFPDKPQLYGAAHRILKPGGCIAFLEAACETRVRLRTEDLIGRVHYESIARYTSLLEHAGFQDIRYFDTTALASQDVASALYGLLQKKEQVIELSGAELYFSLLEIWAEFLSYFSKSKLTHAGMIGRKR